MAFATNKFRLNAGNDFSLYVPLAVPLKPKVPLVFKSAKSLVYIPGTSDKKCLNELLGASYLMSITISSFSICTKPSKLKVSSFNLNELLLNVNFMLGMFIFMSTFMLVFTLFKYLTPP